ncbi:class I SAM-dependent methyltransferase, partial [Streptomyces sp. WAC 05379]
MTATAPPERPRADCAFTPAGCREHTYVPRHLGLTRRGPRPLRAAARVARPRRGPEGWLAWGSRHARCPETATEIFPYNAREARGP